MLQEVVVLLVDHVLLSEGGLAQSAFNVVDSARHLYVCVDHRPLLLTFILFILVKNLLESVFMMGFVSVLVIINIGH